jgi:hypothetical protein
MEPVFLQSFVLEVPLQFEKITPVDPHRKQQEEDHEEPVSFSTVETFSILCVEPILRSACRCPTYDLGLLLAWTPVKDDMGQDPVELVVLDPPLDALLYQGLHGLPIESKPVFQNLGQLVSVHCLCSPPKRESKVALL